MMRAICEPPERLRLLDQSFSGETDKPVETFESAEKLCTMAQGYRRVERPNGETISGAQYTLEHARQDFEAAGQVGHCYECDGAVVYRAPLFACSCTILEAESEALHPAWNLTLETLRRLRREGLKTA